ncbi:MAG TPA: THUMP domain-containing protein [Thermoanaerobaculia bacterium]|nr:THUMP domain-containing protein [Thermoanaerobaculia bacterium]
MRGSDGPSRLRLVATCAPGLEPLLAEELERLGFAGVTPARSAVLFHGGWPEVWRANYWLRTANRVLIEIASFPASGTEDLYAGTSALLGGAAGRRAPPLAGVDLALLLSPARTFAVSATSSRSLLRDTRWIALKVKDAIADAQRARFGRRADVDPRRPDVPLRVRLDDDRATLYLDSSREPLDRRGYRRVSGAAPLREQLAAACVLASGWDGVGPVVDPMCGTGTLLAEAAWIALGRAPGVLRESWVFERWPGFDARRFAKMRTEGPAFPPLDEPERPRPPEGSDDASEKARARLFGRDLSPEAIRAARTNLAAAGLGGLADLEVSDGFAFAPPAPPGLIVVNPAYGERLDTSDDEWRRLGDLLKRRYAGWHCAVIAGGPSFGKHIGLRPRRRIPVKNGPLDAKILVFDLYPAADRRALLPSPLTVPR